MKTILDYLMQFFHELYHEPIFPLIFFVVTFVVCLLAGMLISKIPFKLLWESEPRDTERDERRTKFDEELSGWREARLQKSETKEQAKERKGKEARRDFNDVLFPLCSTIEYVSKNG